IQLLRGTHCPSRGHAKLAHCLLLKRRCGKWRCRLPALGLALDLDDLRGSFGCLFDFRNDCALFTVSSNGELFDLCSLMLNQTRAERLFALVAVEMQRPIFAAFESLDFVLSFYDQSQSRTLDSTRRQAGTDLFPEQWRKIETDQVIECPARLLRVYQRHRDRARMRNRRLNCRFGNLIKYDPSQFFVLQQLLAFQNFREMPGNRLTLAVRVCREIDV